MSDSLYDSKRKALNAEGVRRTVKAYGRTTFESMVLLRLRKAQTPEQDAACARLVSAYEREYARLKTMTEDELREYDPAADSVWEGLCS